MTYIAKLSLLNRKIFCFCFHEFRICAIIYSRSIALDI
uniref:Uncharacterized protein n=1 Tax=Arundo donax TaxID=35708 RepID=A0A0A9F0J7_ARUDO